MPGHWPPPDDWKKEAEPLTDEERAEWVETTLEDHYIAWEASGLDIEEYVRRHRTEIDADILKLPGSEARFGL